MTTLTPRWSVQNSDSVYVFFFFFPFSLRLLCCLLNQSIEFSVSFCRVKFLQFSLYQWGDMNSCVLKKNYCCTLYKMEEKKRQRKHFCNICLFLAFIFYFLMTPSFRSCHQWFDLFPPPPLFGPTLQRTMPFCSPHLTLITENFPYLTLRCFNKIERDKPPSTPIGGSATSFPFDWSGHNFIWVSINKCENHFLIKV